MDVAGTFFPKGQIKSQWIYEIINFLEIDDFISPFWHNLTFSLTTILLALHDGLTCDK